MLSTLLLSLAFAPQPAPQSAPITASEPEAPRPNFLIVLVDDLGYGDLGAALPGIGGREQHRTPNIARLASEGLVLTNGYAAAPNCAPSRACLQTGRTTPRHGVYTVGTAARGKPPQRELIPVQNTVTLADAEVTLAEHLGPVGYSTAHLGKWHLGTRSDLPGLRLQRRGEQGPDTPRATSRPTRTPTLEDGPEGEYLTTRLTDEAIQLVGANGAAVPDAPRLLLGAHPAAGAT